MGKGACVFLVCLVLTSMVASGWASSYGDAEMSPNFISDRHKEEARKTYEAAKEKINANIKFDIGGMFSDAKDKVTSGDMFSNAKDSVTDNAEAAKIKASEVADQAKDIFNKLPGLGN